LDDRLIDTIVASKNHEFLSLKGFFLMKFMVIPFENITIVFESTLQIHIVTNDYRLHSLPKLHLLKRTDAVVDGKTFCGMVDIPLKENTLPWYGIHDNDLTRYSLDKLSW